MVKANQRNGEIRSGVCMMSGKTAILGKIRKSLSVEGNAESRRQKVLDRLNNSPAGIVPKRGQLEQNARVELFTSMAKQVQATVDRVKKRSEIPEVVATYLRDHNLPTQLFAGADERISNLPWDQTPQLQLEVGVCDKMDSVAIACADIGIAETGTVAIFSGSNSPSGNNLLPHSHIVVIEAESIKGDFESLWQFVREKYGKSKMPRSVTLVTGPSRSADIEQTLLLGAHGPRELHLIIVENNT